MQGSDAQGAPVTLGLGLSLLKRSHALGLLALALGLPVAMILPVAWYAVYRDAGTVSSAALLHELVAGLTDSDSEMRFDLWALAVATPLAVVFMAGQRLAWIHLTPIGFSAHIPRWLGLGLVGQTAGDWQVGWEEIRCVHVIPPRRKAKLRGRRGAAQRLGWYRLAVDTDRRTVRLNPFPWFVRGGPDHRLGLREISALGRADIEQALERTPLVQALRARGFEIVEAEAGTSSAPDAGFDLARHPGMLALLAVLFAAGGYALVDIAFTGHYAPLGAIPWWPFLAVAVPAILLAEMLGRGAPRAERVAVGGLAVAALVVAVYPGMLRVNAATAEARVVEYVATAPGRFDPPIGSLPPIDLAQPKLEDYWAQYPSGSHHPFTLLLGAGGFYQLDLAPLYVRTRAFYERQRSAD